MLLSERMAVRFLLPLKYNNGTEIEPFKFNRTREELLKKFGGFSISPFSIDGGWIDSNTATRYFDKSKLFEIEMENTEENQDFLKDYKNKLKKRFKQHEIYMICYPVFRV